MFALTTYEQTGVWDPSDPTQRIRENYASNPGTWASYYWNKVPTTGQLRGMGLGGAGWDSIPGPLQMAIVGITGAIVGYFGYRKFQGTLKPIFSKIPIVGSQFAGLGSGRRRRRRRR